MKKSFFLPLIRRGTHTQRLTGATVSDDDELEAGVIHRLLIRERLKRKQNNNGECYHGIETGEAA
jgi:hypothetical protein